MKNQASRITNIFLMTCIVVLSLAKVNETIGAACIPVITPLSNAGICAGSNGTLTVTSTGGCGAVTGYQWQYNSGTWNNVVNNTPVGFNYGGATSATLTVSGTPTTGSYQYRVVVTCSGGGGCSVGTATSTVATLTVTAVPAAVTVSGGGTFCGSTTITATGGAGGTIYWQGITNGGTSTATASSSQVVSATGTYYFRSYNAASPGCWGTQGSVTVNILPSIAPPALTLEVYDYNFNQINQFSNNVTICQFQQIEFDVASPFEFTENKIFKWKKNGITVLTQNSTNFGPPAISYITSSIANGDVITLTVKWTAPPTSTCYSPDSITSPPITFTVTPNQPPLVFISQPLLPNDTICRGNQLTFTAAPVDAGTPTYQWYMGLNPAAPSPIAGATSSTYTTPALLASGNYTFYCEIVSNEYCDTRDPISFAFPPAAPVTASNSLQLVVNPCYYYVPVSGTLGPFYTCGSPFYDSPLDCCVPYANNVNGLLKLCPATAGQYVTISFTSIALALNDKLRIFGGTPASTFTADTSGIALFSLTGIANSAGCGSIVTSNVSGGCLTAHFKSVTGGAAGWVASVSCSPTPSPGPLPGTDCSNPTIISALPYSVTSHTTQCYGASYQSQTGICNGSYNGEDHVYKYTATGPECTSITLSGTTGNPALAVYQNCPGSAGALCLTPVPQVGNSTAQVTFPSAGDYYIIVDEAGGPAAFSNYNLSILSFGFAPANDLPCNAQYIDLLVNVNGNNSCTGSVSEPGIPGCWTGGTANTTWYSFISPAIPNPSAVHIRTTPGTIGSTQIALYSGSCSSLTLISCNQAGPNCASTPNPSSSDIVYSNLTPSTMYYIRVDGRNNSTGNYNIIVADVNGAQPYADGQDCVVPMTICNSSFTVGDPGFLETGWVCDFGTSNSSCMFAGERSSAWYVFTTNNSGTLSWLLTPNGNTYVDYDWILMDITSFGSDQASRIAGACPQINTGNLPWVRCNISDVILFAPCATSQWQTGMCPASGAISTGPGGPSFCSSLAVANNQTFLLQLSNWTQNQRGFTIDFNAFGASPIAYQNPPSVLYWTAGANTTDWFNPVNWGNCGPPNCNTNAIITTGSVFMPAIQAGQTASCKNLDIKSGASVTMNGTAQLNICGNFVNNGSLIAATTATVNAQGNLVQYFDGNMIGSSKFGNLTMSKTLNNMTILDNAQVAGNLKLANAGIGGKIITGPKELYVTNNAAGAVLAGYGSPTSFVQGYLRRNLNGAAGAYFFPVGDAVKGWQLTKVDFTAAHTIPDMLAYFTQWPAIPAPSGVFDGPCNVTYNTAPAFLDNGYWTLTASANPASATYNMILYNTNVTNNSGCCAWTVMKGASTASLALNGTCDGTSTAAQTKRSGMSGFSVFASAYSSNPLPITLLNFDAVAQGAGVITSWVTASEINNDFFVIERSDDGVNFEQVGTRKGAGNSSTTLYYSMLDMKPLKGVSYYRLRQVDFDGTESRSQLVAVSFLSNNVLNVKPNPAQTTVNFEFISAAGGVVNLEIIDMLGKVYLSKQVHAKKGVNRFEDNDEINVRNLPQGVYFMQLKPVNSEIIEPMQKRFIKQTREE